MPPKRQTALTPKGQFTPVLADAEPGAARPEPDLLGLIRASLDDDQAVEPVVIDLAGKSSIGDAMVVASGRSARHVGSMADHLVEKLKAAGAAPRVEGKAAADWVLIDAGDVIVHLFRPEVRAFYNIEKMWGGDAPPTDGQPARRLIVEDAAAEPAGDLGEPPADEAEPDPSRD